MPPSAIIVPPPPPTAASGFVVPPPPANQSAAPVAGSGGPRVGAAPAAVASGDHAGRSRQRARGRFGAGHLAAGLRPARRRRRGRARCAPGRAECGAGHCARDRSEAVAAGTARRGCRKRFELAKRCRGRRLQRHDRHRPDATVGASAARAGRRCARAVGLGARRRDGAGDGAGAPGRCRVPAAGARCRELDRERRATESRWRRCRARQESARWRCGRLEAPRHQRGRPWLRDS